MGARKSTKRGRKPAPDYAGPSTSVPSTSVKSANAALIQAVKDLGGDEQDLELIKGIDSDEEETVVAKTQSTDDKSLRKALGAFMKELDFTAVAPAAAESDEEDEEEVSEPDQSDEEVVTKDDEEEVEDEEEEEDEDDDEEESSDAEIVKPAVIEPVKAKKAKQVIEPVEAGKVKTGAVPVVDDPPMKIKSAMQAQPFTSASNIPATTSWPSLIPDLALPASPLEPIQPFAFNGLRVRAQKLLADLPPLSRSGSSSDATFISQILSSGTHQDKLSALVLLVRESPIHAVKELERLRNMAGWKEEGGVGGGGGRDERVAVMRALADWWVSGGGKEAGKLRYFADQPLLSHPALTDRHLLMYAFEDFLKKWFFNILQVLEVLSHDTLPFVRTQALNIVFKLLQGNAEQEQNLLRLGVNKLGDTDKSVSSKASHHILTLLAMHPAMKAVVARDVAALVLKPPTPPPAPVKGGKALPAKVDAAGHARYYGLITLNQITLTNKDQDVAGRLVQVYFEVFREILGDGKGPEEVVEAVEGDAAKESVEKVAGKVEKWRGRRKGAKPKGGRKSALENEQLVDTGDAKMVAAVLTGVNRALPFAKLDDELFTKYMDTLFKITHAGTFNTSIQALVLIFQVCQSRQAVSDRFYRTLYESLFDGRLISSSKQAMYLNLLFKALKADTSLSRVMAFVKRLLQMLGMHQPSFICGALYLLGELFSSTPGLKRMLIEPEDDEEEHFVDAPEENAVPLAQIAESSKKPQGARSEKIYDGQKREPQYANAEASCLWELTPFLDHFHPSVSLQANQLLLSQPLTGSPDISLNTLVSFLDRFVYRNPKKTIQPKGASIMQPSAASDKSGMVINNKGARTGADGYVNSEAFWRLKQDQVPADQLFFHKFFATKLANKESKNKNRKNKDKADSDDEDERVKSGEENAFPEGGLSGSDDDDEEVEEEDEDVAGEEEDSDPEEEEIWKVMKASMPAVGDDMGLSEDEDDSDDMPEDLSGGDAESGDDDDDEEDEDEEDEQEDIPRPKGKGKQKMPLDDDDSDSDFPDFPDEDEDDLISLDDMPDIVLGGPEEASDADDVDEDEVTAGKRKRKEEKKDRKKKRREMPVFGSYEDYAAMIEAGGEEED
ncbi:ribosome biogenesis protein MAK21, partial [Tremellales sp. Uapishka_1]